MNYLKFDIYAKRVGFFFNKQEKIYLKNEPIKKENEIITEKPINQEKMVTEIWK